MLFRFGGEEFVGVLKNIDLEKAGVIVERFRKKVENHAFPQVGKVTISIGFTALLPTDMAASIIDRADQALYYAKGNGRNQAWAYETLIEQNKLTAPAFVEGDIEFF